MSERSPLLAIFEDAEVGHLNPLARTRAAFDLRPGIFTFKERIERMLGRQAGALVCRDEVAEVVAEMHPDAQINPSEWPDDVLLVNGRWIPEEGGLVSTLRKLLHGAESPGSEAWEVEGQTVAAWRHPEEGKASQVAGEFLLSRLWQLVSAPGLGIERDASLLADDAEPTAPWPDLTTVHEERIRIHPSARFGAGVILNASEGPIVVESEAVVGDGAILIGPCHVGAKARLKPGARISNASVGYNSRAGGEISKSILHAHANKAHDGYVGNSYIGEWCNLGADANTSNLRNDYGTLSLYNEKLGKQEPTGHRFIGTIMGDHSACGINVMFNTATVVGVACNLFGAGYQSRYNPSFTWGSPQRTMRNRVPSVVAAAEAMMARRGLTLSDARRRLLERLAAESAG